MSEQCNLMNVPCKEGNQCWNVGDWIAHTYNT